MRETFLFCDQVKREFLIFIFKSQMKSLQFFWKDTKKQKRKLQQVQTRFGCDTLIKF